MYKPNGKYNIRFNRNGCFESADPDDGVSLEHIVPKDFFNQKISFSNDLHNLYPAILIVNRARQTKFFAEGSNGKIKYGICKTSMDAGSVYPRDEAKGMIARAYLYMVLIKQAIPTNEIDQDDIKMFKEWDKEYPPDPIERKRNSIIEKVQGWPNPCISFHPSCSSE